MPHAAAVAVSNAPLLLDGGGGGSRDSHPASVSPPSRTLRAASASNADSSWTPAALSKDVSSLLLPGGTVVDGGSFGGAADGDGGREEDAVCGLGAVPPVDASASAARAVRAMNVGQGVPVVRRHSYTTGMGAKPRYVLIRCGVGEMPCHAMRWYAMLPFLLSVLMCVYCCVIGYSFVYCVESRVSCCLVSLCLVGPSCSFR